jgi:hypothetical protein
VLDVRSSRVISANGVSPNIGVDDLRQEVAACSAGDTVLVAMMCVPSGCTCGQGPACFRTVRSRFA